MNIMMLSPYLIIKKKRDGHKLSESEIQCIVDYISSEEIHDSQLGAFLMATFLMGMDKDETFWLTRAMMESGQVFKFDGSDYVDKHSTGGIGDKTSFILGPIAASCGVKVPMIAGRGLGHTGGTVDKIECIPGFQTSRTPEQFKEQLEDIGIVLIGQTGDIAPADKKLYSLRDVTATIDSIPLITGSIMSKKLAEGANGYVFDIKVGNGAFMTNLTEAKKLARSLISTAKKFDRKAAAYLTDMNQPLGFEIGNALEIKESIDVLKGKGPKDLSDLSIEFAAAMIHIAGKAKSLTSARKLAKASIKNGKAFEKFRELIAYQGGKLDPIDDPSKLKIATEKTMVYPESKSYLKSVATTSLGNYLIELKGGRKVPGETLDLSTGITFLKKAGDSLNPKDPMAIIHHHKDQQDLADDIARRIKTETLKFSKQKTKKLELIKHVID
ncbi:MAG: thymidine phosphorylase [Bacteriovoracaceae bacterium]